MDPDADIAFLNRHGACVAWHPGFLDATEADRSYAALTAELVFNDEEVSRVCVFGRWHVIPRRQTAYGDDGLSYTFSGCTVPARPWTPELTQLRARLHDQTGFRANFMLANLYRSGADSIGWHRDDEVQLRRMDAKTSGLPTATLRLSHGSLLMMCDPTNKLWQHQVPRRGGRVRIDPRLNLTWRAIGANVTST
jgi:DNA oxidative demethylase